MRIDGAFEIPGCVEPATKTCLLKSRIMGLGAEHRFGGDWTEQKLSRLHEYLKTYRHLFTRNERARYFKTWYVDAFAGTGSRLDSPVSQSLFQDVYQDENTTRYRDGSAKIALGLPEPFDRYLFIEKSKTRADQLRATIESEFPELIERCEFRRGDANEHLKGWCGERNWNKERAVVFLDPCGMQVEWSTVETLAATKAIDLWYLFPLGVGVARLLTHDGRIHSAWQKRLNVVLGTTDWRSKFYGVDRTPGLFGNESDTVYRTATVDTIRAFIEERLAGCFEKAARGLVLRNSKASPLFLLCFAAANKRGAPTALRIAQHILDD